MTRSARRAQPEPVADERDRSAPASERNDPDVAAKRKADIEERIRRLEAIIQLRNEHIRDIYVLYRNRSNAGLLNAPEDFDAAAVDKSSADPARLSPPVGLLETLGDWRAETPPETPPEIEVVEEEPPLDDKVESVAPSEKDEADVPTLAEVDEPQQPPPPALVIPEPVVKPLVAYDASSTISDVSEDAKDIESAHEEPDAMDTREDDDDVDDQEKFSTPEAEPVAKLPSTEPEPEPEPEPANESAPDDAPSEHADEPELVESLNVEDAVSSMTPSPPPRTSAPPVTRAQSVAAQKIATTSPEASPATPALQQATPAPAPPVEPALASSPPPPEPAIASSPPPPEPALTPSPPPADERTTSTPEAVISLPVADEEEALSEDELPAPKDDAMETDEPPGDEMQDEEPAIPSRVSSPREPADVTASTRDSTPAEDEPALTITPSAIEAPPPVRNTPSYAAAVSALFAPAAPASPGPLAADDPASPRRRLAWPPEPSAMSVDFDFPGDAAPEPPASPAVLVPESAFTRGLPLPPLAALPPTFNHTAKPAKLQRRREKERKEGAAGRKDDGGRAGEFIPLGLNRWAATMRANPVHKHVKKSAKVLFSNDWRIAQDELLFLRAMDRIDKLKQENMWSFRQLKRAKQPAQIKVHWDYLLDEMKWLRTDFREERKWKVALAHELALACKAWHDASPEDRPAHCSKWTRPVELAGPEEDEEEEQEEEEEHAMAVEATQEIPASQAPSEPMIVEGWQPPAYGTPDPLGPPSPERVPTFDPEVAKAFAAATHAHLDAAEDKAAPRPVSDLLDDLAMKTEEVDQPMFGPLELEVDGDGARDAGLSNGPQTATPSAGSAAGKLGAYRELRDPILALDDDELWIELGKLQVDIEKPQIEPSDKDVPAAPPPPKRAHVRLPEIFPELDPYEALPLTDFEIATNILQVKDRPADKRVDETIAGKLTSTSVFMDAKPTLVSALNPAQKWRNGRWVDLDDAVIHPPSAASDKDLDNYVSELFRMHGTSTTPRPSSIPKAPTNASARVAELPWTKAEDELLKSIVDRFPNNWTLVAEWFNSSRTTIPMDKRTPWDCCERWHRKFGLAVAGHSSDQPRSPSPTLHHEHPNVRMLKRLASQAALGTNTEPRKRRRLLHMQDAVRKMGKKREQQQRATAQQNKRALNASVHETHTKIAKSTLSALELTRMKMERDNQDREDRQRALRQSEATRAAAAQLQNQRDAILQQKLGIMNGQPPNPAQMAALRAHAQAMAQAQGTQGRVNTMPAGVPQGMVPVPMQNLTPAQRVQMQAAMQQHARAQAAQAANGQAGASSSSTSPQLQSSPPQSSPPRPGQMPAIQRPGSTVPADPAAFQAAQQQALHAAMMQSYSSEDQMRQRVAVQNMLASLNSNSGSQGQARPGG